MRASSQSEAVRSTLALKLPIPFARNVDGLLKNFRWQAIHMNPAAGTGTLAKRPAATSQLEGWQYYQTDVTGLGKGLYMIVEGAWVKL